VPPDLSGLHGQLARIVGGEFVAAGPTATMRFAVDGVLPGLRVRPGTQDEVSAVLAACAAASAAVIPWGGGTAMGLGNRPSRADVVVQLDRLDRIVEFDAANMCVTAEAGVKLASLQVLLAQRKEFLPLDPPTDSKVTVGGLLAANLSGPSRLLYGTARDWVLGMRVALPDGERIRCGGKVIKNVSGYDMNKLFIGSLGTLGVITEATFKLLPLPAVRAGVVGLFPELLQAMGAVIRTLESVLLPEALDLLDPDAVALAAPRVGLEAPTGAFGLAVALAGSRETVERQVRDFSGLFRDEGGRVTPLPEGRTIPAWDAIRNVFGFLPVPPAVRVLCKIAVPISRTGEMLASAGTLGRRHGLSGAVIGHAGSGIVRACYLLGPKAPPPDVVADALESLRREAEGVEGSLVLQDGPASLKARVDAWGKPGDAFGVMEQLKAKFDPRGLCSPGRFLGGL
jgi:glycolate oxidase FAD binding subunit